MSVKKTLTPEQASERYIELEKQWEALGKSIKATPRRETKDMYRRRRKRIREEQNSLYPIMVHTGYVEITQDILGMYPKRQSLYKRYARGKKSS